jgi:hypothetical protein
MEGGSPLEPLPQPPSCSAIGGGFDESGQEQVALLQEVAVGVLQSRVRQQPRRLELQQRRRDDQEPGRGLQVEVVASRDRCDVLLGDRGQGHVVDIHPLLRDQVQEEVDRPLEDVELHLVRHGLPCFSSISGFVDMSTGGLP